MILYLRKITMYYFIEYRIFIYLRDLLSQTHIVVFIDLYNSLTIKINGLHYSYNGKCLSNNKISIKLRPLVLRSFNNNYSILYRKHARATHTGRGPQIVR